MDQNRPNLPADTIFEQLAQKLDAQNIQERIQNIETRHQVRNAILSLIQQNQWDEAFNLAHEHQISLFDEPFNQISLANALEIEKAQQKAALALKTITEAYQRTLRVNLEIQKFEALLQARQALHALDLDDLGEWVKQLKELAGKLPQDGDLSAETKDFEEELDRFRSVQNGSTQNWSAIQNIHATLQAGKPLDADLSEKLRFFAQNWGKSQLIKHWQFLNVQYQFTSAKIETLPDLWGDELPGLVAAFQNNAETEFIEKLKTIRKKVQQLGPQNLSQAFLLQDALNAWEWRWQCVQTLKVDLKNLRDNLANQDQWRLYWQTKELLQRPNHTPIEVWGVKDLLKSWKDVLNQAVDTLANAQMYETPNPELTTEWHDYRANCFSRADECRNQANELFRQYIYLRAMPLKNETIPLSNLSQPGPQNAQMPSVTPPPAYQPPRILTIQFAQQEYHFQPGSDFMVQVKVSYSDGSMVADQTPVHFSSEPVGILPVQKNFTKDGYASSRFTLSPPIEPQTFRIKAELMDSSGAPVIGTATVEIENNLPIPFDQPTQISPQIQHLPMGKGKFYDVNHNPVSQIELRPSHTNQYDFSIRLFDSQSNPINNGLVNLELTDNSFLTVSSPIQILDNVAAFSLFLNQNPQQKETALLKAKHWDAEASIPVIIIPAYES